MNESIKKFMEKFSADEELQAKFAAVKSPEEAYELAKSIQDGFTLDEFIEACQAMNEADEGDLSDEDLAATAGGEDVTKADEYKDLMDQVSIDVPRSGVESAIIGDNLSVGPAVSGVVSATATKVDDAVGGNAVSNYIKNSVKSASKAIKNALP